MTDKDRARAIRDLADAVHWVSAAIDSMTDGDLDAMVLGEIGYASEALDRAKKRIGADMAERAKRTAALDSLPHDLGTELLRATDDPS